MTLPRWVKLGQSASDQHGADGKTENTSSTVTDASPSATASASSSIDADRTCLDPRESSRGQERLKQQTHRGGNAFPSFIPPPEADDSPEDLNVFRLHLPPFQNATPSSSMSESLEAALKQRLQVKDTDTTSPSTSGMSEASADGHCTDEDVDYSRGSRFKNKSKKKKKRTRYKPGAGVGLPNKQEERVARPTEDDEKAHEHELEKPPETELESIEISVSVSAGSEETPESAFSEETKETQPQHDTIQWVQGQMLGEGTFGKVYKALNKETGQMLAVKRIKLPKQMTSANNISQMTREIRMLEKLQHPNIVQLLDVQTTENTLDVIMEYVAGNSLHTQLQDVGALPETLLRKYAFQICAGLAYCHSLGIIHRDIKAQNVLVDQTGNIKLADFGSAKQFQFTEDNAPSVSYSYTPLWTAPEVVKGNYNSKVDVWSLGCVCIEMATAKTPFHEMQFHSPFQALYHIGNGGVPAIPPGLSPIAADFIQVCLQVDPHKRPSAAQLLNHRFIRAMADYA